MPSLLKQYFLSRNAAILPMAAILFPIIMGMAGVGIDFSSWMKDRRELQTATDAAALAAAYEYSYGGDDDDVEAAAIREAINNGFDPDGDASEIIVTIYEDENEVEVEMVAEARTYLARMFMDNVLTRTRAIAQILGEDSPADFCMLSLEPSADNAFVINGNVDIDAVGCGIAVNSTGDPALNVNGGAGDLDLGNVQVVGTCNDCDLINTPSVVEGVAPFDDPYADLELPVSFIGCTEDEVDDGPIGDPDDIPAPDADGVVLLCGGLNLKGKALTITLAPGIYIVDGGDFATSNNITVNGDGVTIILTNSGGNDYGDTPILNTNGDINLTAPGPGDLDPDWSDFEGVVMYGDRNLDTPNKCNNVRGQGTVIVSGAMYFPTNCIDFGGGSSAGNFNGCSRIIATTIKIHGNPDIANNCKGTGARDILGGAGASGIRLVW